MSKPSIVGISGNVSRPSRTQSLVSTVLRALAQRIPAETRQIELIEAAPTLFAALTADQLSDEGRALLRIVEQADILVVGTPVYRASYTGALKHLFDLLRNDALAGKPVILAATGGSGLHGLVTEHQLRPLLGFFNALTVPTTIYATEADFNAYELVNPALHARIERAVAEAAHLAEIARDPGFNATARQPIAANA